MKRVSLIFLSAVFLGIVCGPVYSCHEYKQKKLNTTMPACTKSFKKANQCTKCCSGKRCGQGKSALPSAASRSVLPKAEEKFNLSDSNGQYNFNPVNVDLPSWVNDAGKTMYVDAAPGQDMTRAIQSAIDSLGSAGGKIILRGGNYTCSGVLTLGSNVTLEGEGSDKTFLDFKGKGYLALKNSNVMVRGLHVSSEGMKHDWGTGAVKITASNVAVVDVTGTCDSGPMAVFFVLSNGKNLENLYFANCVADNPGAFGFMHNSWSGVNTHKNVTYLNCQAINCGRYERANDWVTGFNFGEQNNIENLYVEGCLAEGAWESGYHFEYAPMMTNATFKNCASKDNGQKRAISMTGRDNDEKFFGAGFNIRVAKNVDFIDCSSSGDATAGFHLLQVKGGSLQNCTVDGAGTGQSKVTTKGVLISTPVSFWLHACNGFDVSDCSSAGSRGFGLYIYNMRDGVNVSNFQTQNDILGNKY